METENDINQDRAEASVTGSLVAPDEPETGKPLDNVDPVWLALICIFTIVVTTTRLTSSNVERERPIAGGHYKGKVTPGWLKHFQKQEALREENNRSGLQEAIRTRRR